MLEIKIFTGEPDTPFQAIREIKARVGAATALSKTPTIEDVNLKLQEEASKVGADAVINVSYNRGISATSWKALTATGTAVKLESTDFPCPVCAETIKRAAAKCRFCGTELK